MPVTGIIQLILLAITQLVPLVEELQKQLSTSTATPEDLATIDAQLAAAHAALGKLVLPPTPVVP